MKKAIKVVNIVLIVATMMLLFSTTVMGADGIIDQLNPDYSDDSGMASLGQKIINYISTAAIIIAVIVLVILGIKYMIGSASEKAEYKKTMIPYLVGAVLVFGAGAIAKVVVSVTTNLTSTT